MTRIARTVEVASTAVLTVVVATLAFVVLRRELRSETLTESTTPPPISFIPDWKAATEVAKWDGRPDSQIQILEFADLQCPACREASATVQKIALDPAVPISEVFTVLTLEMQQPELRAATWDWLQQNFAAVGARVPGFAKPFLLQLAAPFCDAAAEAQVKEFSDLKVRELGAGELEAGRTVESIGLCTALKAAHAAELDALVAN